MKKILFLAANPKHTSQLRLDEELREIQEVLRRSIYRNRFKLKSKSAVRLQDFQRAILEEKPQIVHFSGHGSENEGLFFEDKEGYASAVTGEAIAGLFDLFKDYLECVVLNSCFSQVQAEAIAQQVPYVIGIPQTIEDKEAIIFATSFYDALSAGESFEFSYQFGRRAITLNGYGDATTPIFLTQFSKVEQNKPSHELVTTEGVSTPMPSLRDASLVDMSTKEPHVFISYSRGDKKFADKLAAHLHKSGIPIWIDYLEIKAGDSIQARIEQAIINASFILVILSPASTNSNWVTQELRLAITRQLDEQKRLIIPILRKECKIPIFLRDRLYIDFQNPRKFDVNFQNLLASIDTKNR